MVDREHSTNGCASAPPRPARCGRPAASSSIERDADGTAVVTTAREGDGRRCRSLRARAVVIGADGAARRGARRQCPGAGQGAFVFAYHEIVAHAGAAARRLRPHALRRRSTAARCSPDFYGWVFPHGDTLSSAPAAPTRASAAQRGRRRCARLPGWTARETMRREGAPMPMKPLPRWDNGRDVVLAGDAAGVVAPASGEGIYYAMVSGRLAAEAVRAFLATGDARALAQARKRFMNEHGRVFWVLGIMQRFWYSSDKRRERFVRICRDKDVQRLTFDAYMNKRLVRTRPMAHVRIFFKDMAHLLGLGRRA